MPEFPYAMKRIASAPEGLNAHDRRLLILGLKILIMTVLQPLSLADRTRVLLALQAGINDELEAYETEV